MACVCCDPLGTCCPEGRTPDAVILTITGFEFRQGVTEQEVDILGSYLVPRSGNSCSVYNAPGIDIGGAFISVLAGLQPVFAVNDSVVILISYAERNELQTEALRADPGDRACMIAGGSTISGQTISQSNGRTYDRLFFTIESA